jgi:hypothetical protein
MGATGARWGTGAGIGGPVGLRLLWLNALAVCCCCCCIVRLLMAGRLRSLDLSVIVS